MSLMAWKTWIVGVPIEARGGRPIDACRTLRRILRHASACSTQPRRLRFPA
jgi:hypothetical protein